MNTTPLNLRFVLRFALTLLIGTALLGASCGVKLRQSGESTSEPTGGGVYKSDNQGKAWQQVVFVEQADKRTVTIAGLGIQRLLLSPVDPNHVYAMAGLSGLYESRDGGAHWKQLYQKPVQGVVLHPTNREVLYVASANQILRSADGGLTWVTVYIESTPQVTITDMDIVSGTPKTLYAVTNKGVLLRSDNEGGSWRKVYFFKQAVSRLYVNQALPRVLYLATPGGALWRSADGGEVWTEITTALREQLKVPLRQFRAVTFIPGRTDALLYANQQGLYRTPDGGVTWEEVKIVTAPAAVSIAALAVNPKRADDLYYATAAAFYHSANGGATWSTMALPANLIPGSLIHHPADGKTLYLGFTR